MLPIQSHPAELENIDFKLADLLNFHQNKVTVLLSSGHYDILYREEDFKEYPSLKLYDLANEKDLREKIEHEDLKVQINNIKENVRYAGASEENRGKNVESSKPQCDTAPSKLSEKSWFWSNKAAIGALFGCVIIGIGLLFLLRRILKRLFKKNNNNYNKIKNI